MANGQSQPESPRRRIVVPLGQDTPRSARAASPRLPARPAKTVATTNKGRAGKILAILGILIVITVSGAGAGAFFWWQYYKTTPSYTLALLVDAAQRNDMTAVDQFVDTDKVVDNFANQVADKAAARYGGALSSDVRKQIQTTVPTLLPVVKQQVREVIAARVKEISAKAEQKPFFAIALGLPWFVRITTDGGEVADATIAIQDQQVVLQLARSGDAWKVVAMQDDRLVQRLVDEVIKDLPAIGPDMEKNIRKSLKKTTAGNAGIQLR